jgi:hypothetical protein
MENSFTGTSRGTVRCFKLFLLNARPSSGINSGLDLEVREALALGTKYRGGKPTETKTKSAIVTVPC